MKEISKVKKYYLALCAVIFVILLLSFFSVILVILNQKNSFEINKTSYVTLFIHSFIYFVLLVFSIVGFFKNGLILPAIMNSAIEKKNKIISRFSIVLALIFFLVGIYFMGLGLGMPFPLHNLNGVTKIALTNISFGLFDICAMVYLYSLLFLKSNEEKTNEEK